MHLVEDTTINITELSLADAAETGMVSLVLQFRLGEIVVHYS